ncbi:MAG: dockerin type I domain-containing protein, partial [candidate division Zixibacteria bacterium]|nr:dockerin type I domain-containing protein [candidate division Zixibacteria bacterium]
FAGGDTYELAVAQFGLHGTSGDATEVDALAALANKWLGFGRGDVNNDGAIDVGDVVCLARYVNGTGPGPIPFMHLGDVDCDGDVDMDDVIYLAEFLYNDGPCPCGDWCF